jgi:hypothetical protein
VVTQQPAAPRQTLAWRVERALFMLDHRAGKHDRTRRLRDVIAAQRGWYDWPHRLMALVGRNDSGNWGPPRVRDLYFRDEWVYPPIDPDEPIDRAKHAGTRVFEVTRDGWEAWQGAKRGETWRTFDSQDDGNTIRVGYLGGDGRLRDSGIDGRQELRRFVKWLLWDGWVLAEGFGLRRWAYYVALNGAVRDRRPFTCRLVPPEGTGAYSHWACDVPVGWRGTLRRWAGRPVEHEGPHRFRNYSWVAGAGRVQYEPSSNR